MNEVVVILTVEQVAACGVVPVMVLEDAEQAVPTGGINQSNAAEYFRNPKILAVGGSWMVTKDMVAAGDFDGITEKSAAATSLFREIRG